MSEMESSVNKHDRSAIVTGIAKAVFDLLQGKVCQYQELSESPGRYAQTKDAIPDDDASVLRVSGFALHSCI